MVALDALLSKKRQMMNLTRRRGVSPELIGVDLDGANDYGSRGSDLVGNADGKTFTFATWIWIDSISSVYHLYKVGGDGGNFSIEINASRQLVMWGHNAAFTEVFLATVTSPLPAIQTFNHILVSVDLANSGNRHVYINDAAATVTWTTYTNQEIDFTGGAHSIGALNNGTEKFKGRLAGLFLDYTYRDLSNSANRRLFIDSEGFYVKPPTTGILCVPFDDPSEPFRNDGTGGAFTQNGVIARSGRGVNQYNPAASTFVKTADYLSIAALSGIADGKDFTIVFTVKTPTGESPDIFHIGDGSGIRFQIQPNSSNGNVRVFADNASGTEILDVTIPGGVSADKYTTVALTVGLASSSTRKAQVNGEDVVATWSTYTDDSIDFTYGTTYVGYNTIGGAGNFSGQLSDFWFDDSYTADLSGFYDTDTGKPKFLGIDGSLPTGSPPLVYLPMRGNDAGNNAGTGGDFTVNSGPYTGARGPSEFWSGSMETNGSTQYVSRSSALTGAVDGKLATVAFSYKTDVTTGLHFLLSFSQSGDKFTIYQDAQVISIRGANAAGSTILSQDVAAFFSDTNWHNVLLSFDMADTGKFDLYKDGALIAGSATTHTNDSVKFTTTGVGISADPTGSGKFDGKIGFLYFTTEYIDFSQEANRLKFFDAFGYPVDIGADGSLPTGTPPLIYMNSGFHLGTNLGTGGDFTPQNAPTDGGFVRG